MRHSTPGQVWRLAVPYWQSEERWQARILLAVIVALTLGLVLILVLLNDWNRQFYEALQTYNVTAFGPLLLRFSLLAGLYITGAVYKLYCTQMLEMRWRLWLTRRFLSAWLDKQVYYHLELEGRTTDNPDQRIADDLQLFTSSTLGLGLGLLSAVVTLASFIAILWSISGPLSFTLGGVEIAIPGYMVWAAILYALVGSVLTRLIGRPLIGLNFQRQRFEADFRFGLIRIRENADAIALYGGEKRETEGLLSRFERIRANWWQLMRYTKYLTFFSVGYNQVAVVFPFLVAAPRYFSNAITLGVLMQIANAFGQVQGALSWFVDNYASIATWQATTDRLLTFQEALELTLAEATRPDRVAVAAGQWTSIHTRNLELALPNGRVVLANGAFTLEPGDHVLVRGPNGSGKSTLFRAIAGIWPYGRGHIHIPDGARMLFVPQRPYLPIATLRDAVCYPSSPGTFSEDQIHTALRAAGMGHFVDRLDEMQNWTQQLSGGEQQRIALVGALLQRPEWLFLDEATAALDESSEIQAYELIQEYLPTSTVVSIAHRPRVAEYHTRTLRLVMAPDRGPSSVVLDSSRPSAVTASRGQRVEPPG